MHDGQEASEHQRQRDGDGRLLLSDLKSSKARKSCFQQLFISG